MSGSVRGDYSQLDQLARALRGAPARVTRQAVQATKRSALNVKRDAQKRAREIRHAPTHIPYYPDSISYDVSTVAGGGIVAEIGPDKSKPQGALGNLIEYGSANNPPHPHLNPAVEAERANYLSELGKAGVAAMFPGSQGSS